MSPRDRRFIHLLIRAQRHVSRLLEQRVQADADITATQAGVLFYLMKNDGSMSRAVAEAVGIAAPAMSGLADRMEHAGLRSTRVIPLTLGIASLYIGEKG